MGYISALFVIAYCVVTSLWQIHCQPGERSVTARSGDVSSTRQHSVTRQFPQEPVLRATNRSLSAPHGSVTPDAAASVHILCVNGDQWVVVTCVAGTVTVSALRSINHLFVKASKMTVTKVSAQDQKGSESTYNDPKTKAKYAKKYKENTNSESNHKKPIIVQ